MIDPFREKLMPLAKAARSIPGRKVSPQAVYRWIHDGISGVRLECIHIGGRMQTSEEALTRFFQAVTEARQRPSNQDDSNERPERVSQQLEAAGLV